MAQIVLGPSRAYPNVPTIGDDIASHTQALNAIVEALNIHERRIGKSVLDSFVRVRELETLGLADIEGNIVTDASTEESTTHHHDSTYLRLDGTNDPVTGSVSFSGGLSATGLTAGGAIDFSGASTLDVTGVVITGLSSDDLSDVASIAMLDEAETVTGLWTFDGGLDVNSAGTEVLDLTQSGSVDLNITKSGTGDLNITNSGTGSIVVTGTLNLAAATISGLSSDDLSDVASIAMLDEAETVTGAWTFTPRIVLSTGFQIPDSSAYIWNLTGATTWGQYWNTTTNAVEFHAGGAANIILDLDAGSIFASTDIQLGNQLGDRVGVYGTLDVATSYGIGIESSTMYYKSNSIHRWYVGQNADGGVAHKMALTGSALDVNVNANFAAGIDVTGNVNATSHGGIAQANLLDKTAVEEVTANWKFKNIENAYWNSVDVDPATDEWYEIAQVTDSFNTPVLFLLTAYAHSGVMFTVSKGYQGGSPVITVLNSHVSSTNAGYKYVKAIRVVTKASTGGFVQVQLNSGATVSLNCTAVNSGRSALDLYATPTQQLGTETVETTVTLRHGASNSPSYDVDGGDLRLYDPGKTDYVILAHDGTNFTLNATNTAEFDLIGLTRLDLNTGCDLRIRDVTGAGYADFAHNGTNFTTAFTNTADWSVSGFDTLVLTSDVTTSADNILELGSRFTFRGDGVMYWGSAAAHGFLSWNTGEAIVASSGGNDLMLVPSSGVVGTKSNLRVWDGSKANYMNIASGTDVDITFSGITEVNWTGAPLQMADEQIIRPVITDYGVTHQTLSINTGTTPDSATIDCTAGNSAYLDLESAVEDIEVFFTNPPASGTYGEINLIVQQGTTPRDITWPAAVDWKGTTPILSVDNNTIDVFHFFTIDGGTTWIGTYALDATPAAVGELNDLSDVTIISVASGELLKYNGSAWVNNTLAEAGVAAASHTHVIADVTDFTDNSTNWDTAFGWGNHASAGYLTGITAEPLSDLSDVTITTIAANEILKWNGTAWINNTLAEAGIAAASHTHVIADVTDFTDNSTNWNAAYNDKINSASFATGTGILTLTQQDAGTVTVDLDGRYLTSYTETDTLADVTGRGATTATASTFSGGINMADSDLNRPVIEDYGVKHQTLSINTGTTPDSATIDCTLGNSAYLDLESAVEDIEVFFTNPSASGTYCEINLIVQQGTTARAITWPAAVDWKGDTPILSTTNNTIDVFHFFTIDGGTTWIGTYALDATPAAVGALNDLTDVTLTSPADGAVLIYDTGTAQWRDFTLSGDATMTDSGVVTVADNSHNHLWSNITSTPTTVAGYGITDALTDITGEPLSDLSDVTITTIAANEILKWNGTAWINNTLAEAGIAATSHTHVEADITDLGAYLLNVVEDTTPQLGGNLDMNGKYLDNCFVGAEGSITLETITTGNWSKPAGWSRMVSLSSTGVPSGASHGYAFITARRDTGNGYGIMYQDYSNGKLWSGYHSTGGDPTWVNVWTSADFTDNSANWDTAYGWGNHAGLYEPIDAEIAREDTRVDFQYDLRLRGGSATPNLGIVRMYVDASNVLYLDAGNDGLNVASLQQNGQFNVTGGNSSQWNTAYNDKINSASFATGTGILTLTQQDAGTITVDLDGRYLTSYTETDTLADVTGRGATTATASTFSGGINMADSDLNRPVLEDYGVKHQTLSINTGTTPDSATIDCTVANSAYLDLESAVEDIEVFFTNPPASGTYGEINLVVQQGTTARDITWPAAVDWKGATPVLSTTNNAIDVFHFFTIDGGTTWIGTYAVDGAAATGATQLDDLSDVTLTTPADGAIMIYDTGTAQWRDFVLSGDATMTDGGVVTVADNSHNHLWSNITSTPTTVAGYGITDALTTATNFGGDVSGTYNAIVVANDSHTHAFNNLTGKTSGTGNYQTTGDMIADNFEATGLGPNVTPGTDDLYIGGYGIMGDRTQAVYVTNANATGTVQINCGGVHGAGAKVATFSTTGMDLTGNITLTGTVDGIDLAAIPAANIAAGSLVSGVNPYITGSATSSSFQVLFGNTTSGTSGAASILKDSAASQFTYNPSTNTLYAANASSSKVITNGVFMNELASAGTDVGGDGQLWVKSNTPNDLYFTTDSGLDYPVAYARYRVTADTTLDGANISETLGVQHINGVWYSDNATAYTLTLQASGVTTFPVGAQMTIWNEGSGTLTITEGSGTTLYLMDGSAVTDTAGGCTMAQGGYATLIRKSTTVYLIMGAGLTA